jgi:hypothetical protein
MRSDRQLTLEPTATAVDHLGGTLRHELLLFLGVDLAPLTGHIRQVISIAILLFSELDMLCSISLS